MLQRDRQVKGIVGVTRISRQRIKKRLLRFVPAFCGRMLGRQQGKHRRLTRAGTGIIGQSTVLGVLIGIRGA